MRVRVAVDRMHEPEAVINVAGAWAARLGATVDLLFVGSLAATPAELAEQQRLLNLVPESQRGESHAWVGRPAEQIVADLKGIDLVMVGTHGWRGLTHLVLGSVAERVVRTCTVPVMVLRRAPDSGPLQALVAVDASRPDASRTLDDALKWLQELGAQVDLVHVERLADTTPMWMDPGTMDADIQARILDALAAQRGWDQMKLAELLARVPEPMRGTTRFVDGDPSRSVADAARDYDLTVLTTHGRTGLERLWLGSVTEAAIRRAKTTVLVLRQPDAP